MTKQELNKKLKHLGMDIDDEGHFKWWLNKEGQIFKNRVELSEVWTTWDNDKSYDIQTDKCKTFIKKLLSLKI